jgi:hypothetical protein
MNWCFESEHYRCSKCGYVYTGVNPQGDSIVGFDIPEDASMGLMLKDGKYYCTCGGEALVVPGTFEKREG